MNTSITKPTLLVADDEAEIGEIIEVVAEDLGFEVTCVTNGSKVVGLVEELSPTVVALDLRMPGADAVEIIRELGKKECDSSFLLMSGMDQRTLSAVKALGKENNLDIGATLTKPMSLDAIEEALLPYLRAQNNSVAAVETEPVAEQVKLGLNLLYEPEFQLKNVADVVSKQRMRVCAQWHKTMLLSLLRRSLIIGREISVLLKAYLQWFLLNHWKQYEFGLIKIFALKFQ